MCISREARTSRSGKAVKILLLFIISPTSSHICFLDMRQIPFIHRLKGSVQEQVWMCEGEPH